MTKLKTSDLLAPRLLEAVVFLRGGLASERYPTWAQKLGVKIAEKVVPAATRESAAHQPIAFTDGFVYGFMLKLGPGFGKLPAENAETLPAMLSAVRIPDFNAQSIKQIIELSGDVQSQVSADIGAHLNAEPAKRLAFFRGIVAGLEFDALLETSVDLLDASFKNPKSLFPRHLFFWAHWPEIEKLESPAQAFEFLRKKFDAIGRGEVMANKKAFRTFCERIGYYERQRRIQKPIDNPL